MKIDNTDAMILKFLTKREHYQDYKDLVTKGTVTKISWEIIKDFGAYYEQNPSVLEIVPVEFNSWYRMLYKPGRKVEEQLTHGHIIDSICSNKPEGEESFRRTLVALQGKAKINRLSASLAAGSITMEDFSKEVAALSIPSVSECSTTTYTLDGISSLGRTTGGLYWRLEDLNRSIGPVGTGDLVVVGKRPEVGGTSFLVSEMSYMLEQMPTTGKAVIFNNEEAPDKVWTRLVSAALGADYRTLMTDPSKYQKIWETWLGGREIDVIHESNMTVKTIHAALAKKKYDLIGINVLLKVGGTGKLEDHDKFQFLGEECRRIALNHAPVIAITQADPSAENTQFIPMDRIYKSKTALQGEADVLIMIGKDDSQPEDIRYIYVAKNKIPPSSCVDLTCKHIKSEVNFDTNTGRFSSRNFKGHSREVH